MAKGYFDIQVDLQVNSALDDELNKIIQEGGELTDEMVERLAFSVTHELIANREYLKSRIEESLEIGHFAYTFTNNGPGKEICWRYSPTAEPRWQQYRGCTCLHCLKFDP